MSRQMMLTVLFSAAAAAMATLAVQRLVPLAPASAVVAFDVGDKCPQGWEDYTEANGRAIIGAGQGSGLSRRDFGSTGGQEMVTWSEIGLSRFQTLTGRRGLVIRGVFAPRVGYRREETPEILDIPTMSPFVVLRFCRKN